MLKPILTTILFLMATHSALSCGDVQMWVERYFNGQQLTALKFVHCPEIVNNYASSTESDAHLLRMLTDAMNGYETSKKENDSFALCLRNLVLKNFLSFGKLKNVSQTPEYEVLMQKMADAFSMSASKWKDKMGKINALPTAFVLSDEYYSNSDYCDLVANEVTAFLGE